MPTRLLLNESEEVEPKDNFIHQWLFISSTTNQVGTQAGCLSDQDITNASKLGNETTFEFTNMLHSDQATTS